MNRKFCYILWGVLFALCAALGFVPAPEGAGATLMTVLSVVFFIPPMALILDARKRKDPKTLQLIRNLSLLSLGLTVAALITNAASLGWSRAVGDALYGLLIVVSSPMICSRYWLLSLFLWACLLMMTLRDRKK